MSLLDRILARVPEQYHADIIHEFGQTEYPSQLDDHQAIVWLLNKDQLKIAGWDIADERYLIDIAEVALTTVDTRDSIRAAMGWVETIPHGDKWEIPEEDPEDEPVVPAEVTFETQGAPEDPTHCVLVARFARNPEVNTRYIYCAANEIEGCLTGQLNDLKTEFEGQYTTIEESLYAGFPRYDMKQGDTLVSSLYVTELPL